MSTHEFFQAVLPDTGPYYVIVMKAGSKPAHKQCDTIDLLAEAVEKYNQNPQYAVYFSCASGTAAEGKRRVTPESPDGKAKALWIDIDCGEDKAATGKGYLDKKAAAAALSTFCAEAEFPAPMIVDSGGGLHCYWRLTKALPYKQWYALASVFKQVLASKKLLADDACTSDFSRILRPVGTTNRKRGDRVVKTLRECREFTPTEILAHLKRLRVNLPPPAPPKALDIPDDLNDDLTAHGYIEVPSSMLVVADECKQVAIMRDTKGDVAYDHWRGVIGLCKHSIEGLDLAVEWSAEREATGHKQTDVKHKYDTWNSGPTTCNFLSEKNPGGCDGCKWAGNINTPLVLGRIMPEETAPTTVEAVVEGKTEKVEVPALPPSYRYENGMLIRYLKDKEGILQPHGFCRSLFYPTYRVKREDGSFGLGIRMHLPDGRIRDFDIDTGLLASPAKLMEELGARGEIVQHNTKDAPMHTTAYLRDMLEKLKNEAEEMNTLTSFGWKYDLQAFLIGDRLYHRDGTTRRVLVGGYAADAVGHFPAPRGTAAGYAQGLNHVYARAGMEPMQYAICSGFGSILTPFGENLYRGLLVAVTGGESGRGKSSVCHASMYAFGDAAKMTIATDKGATVNSLYGRMGAYGSLPVLFDEYTSIEAKEFSEFSYRVSHGSDKNRQKMQGSSVRMAAQMEWWMSPFVTANKDLHAILAQHTANSQAEAVRLVQIKIDQYKIPQLADGEVDSALTQMRVNAGSAGELFIKFCVGESDKVFEMFQETLAEISKHIQGPKYRYYRNHAAATLAAAQITNQLGITAFDYPALFDFAIRLMRQLCAEVQESNTVSSEDALSMMVSELTPRILTTNEYRDGRDARGPEQTNRIQHAFAGRYIIGTGRLYLVKKDAKDWCVKHRLDLANVLSFAKTRGCLIDAGERFNLTKGTGFAPVQISCLVLDMNALGGGAVPNLVLHAGSKPIDSGKTGAV